MRCEHPRPFPIRLRFGRDDTHDRVDSLSPSLILKLTWTLCPPPPCLHWHPPPSMARRPGPRAPAARMENPSHRDPPGLGIRIATSTSTLADSPSRPGSGRSPLPQRPHGVHPLALPPPGRATGPWSLTPPHHHPFGPPPCPPTAAGPGPGPSVT